MVHRGSLLVEGTASSGFVFRHPDGTFYGGAIQPKDIDAAAQAFDALTNLGFSPTRARRLLQAARRQGVPADDVQALISEALRAS
jgi:Holliday junction resolvasome RuvABC DNA-binding subunit